MIHEGIFESSTEQRLPGAADLDALATLDILRLMNEQDRVAVTAVAAVLPQVAALVDEADARLRRGGRVHYFGAGTSGRLGVLDAAELVPTFSLDPRIVTAHLAGGPEAMFRAVENSEDSYDDGFAEAGDVDAGSLAIGLAASGRTPYVGGALARARANGAFTALITSNPKAELGAAVDLFIAVDTGPEVLSGSTRLKAGTAEKIVLNGFSTALMVRQGRTWGDLMVSVQATNAKLRARIVRILADATATDLETAAAHLDAADGELKTALVASLGSVSPAQAREALALHRDSARAALDALEGPSDVPAKP